MNQEDIFKKIGQILNELQDQYDFLAQNPQQLNELELELFLANANFLSDHVQIVRKINSARAVKELSDPTQSLQPQVNAPVDIALPEVSSSTEPVIHIAPVPEPKVEEVQMEQIELEELQQEDVLEQERPSFEFILKEESLSDKFEFEEKSVNEIFDRPLSEEEQRIIAAKQRQNEVVPEPPSPEVDPVLPIQAEASFVVDKPEEKEVSLKPTAQPILDNIEHKIVQPPAAASVAKPTLNELLAARNSGHATFNEGNNKPAITDLKGGISLNEKLLYIKDLFNGYNLAYSEAIDLINKMPDLKTADVFLQKNYAEKNNWATKQNTVDKFYALLAQRFPEG